MKAFEYASPASVEDAVKALAGRDAEALSGGTDLISRMKDYVTSPARVVYLKDIKDLAGIAGSNGGGLTLGAGTRLVEILDSREVAAKYPALRQATLEVGTPQIRNMATLGGNLLQRPRCWYYRAGFGLLGRKAAGRDLVRELEGEFAPVDVDAPGQKNGVHLVRAGDNRYHAIFLTDGDALFVSPSSLAIPLIALGAQATIVGPDGARTIPVADLYRVPKTEQERELTIAPGELLSKVEIPAPKGKNASYEARQKRAHDWPLVLCSVNVELDGQAVSAARVVIYGVAPIPWRSAAAEKAITGKAITRETAAAAGDAAVEGAKPLSKNGYKVPLTRAVVKRALLAAAGDRYWEEA